MLLLTERRNVNPPSSSTLVAPRVSMRLALPVFFRTRGYMLSTPMNGPAQYVAKQQMRMDWASDWRSMAHARHSVCWRSPAITEP